MESHELLRDILKQQSAKEIAAKLDLSLQRVYQWSEAPEPVGSGTPNPLDRVDALLRATGDPRIAQWICERAGGFFMANPKLEKHKSVALVAASHLLIQEFATMITLISDVTMDGKINKSETEDIRGRWEKIKSVSEFFVKCCEEGRFRGEGVGNGTSGPKV